MFLNFSQIGSFMITKRSSESGGAVSPHSRLKMLLSECGYRIFRVKRQRQRHRANMVIIHPDESSSAMWLYRRDDGEVIVRPLVDSFAYRRLIARLATKTSEDFGLKAGATLKLRKDSDPAWVSWLSETAKEEAHALGYI